MLQLLTRRRLRFALAGDGDASDLGHCEKAEYRDSRESDQEGGDTEGNDEDPDNRDRQRHDDRDERWYRRQTTEHSGEQRASGLVGDDLHRALEVIAHEEQHESPDEQQHYQPEERGDEGSDGGARSPA